MALNFSRIVLPSIIVFTIYIIINKLFPKKVESFWKDPRKNLRGANQIKLAKQIT